MCKFNYIFHPCGHTSYLFAHTTLPSCSKTNPCAKPEMGGSQSWMVLRACGECEEEGSDASSSKTPSTCSDYSSESESVASSPSLSPNASLFSPARESTLDVLRRQVDFTPHQYPPSHETLSLGTWERQLPSSLFHDHGVPPPPPPPPPFISMKHLLLELPVLCTSPDSDLDSICTNPFEEEEDGDENGDEGKKEGGRHVEWGCGFCGPECFCFGLEG